MKIAIVTAFYEPINNPRSFRATELAKGFARKGHEVHVFNPINYKEYSYEKLPNLKLKQLNVFSSSQRDLGRKKPRKAGQRILSFLKKKMYYFTTNSHIFFFLKLKKQLCFEEHYDLLISIALPFHVHWAVYSKIKNKSVADCYIADYGDPFSKYNKTSNVAPYFRKIERTVLKHFDYITCPVEKAISSYLWLKPKENIFVIPQGFDFSNVQIFDYKKNSVPTFAYAGLFYAEIRNPKILFDYLVDLDFDFRFIIYTDMLASESYNCIIPYLVKLKNKLIVNDLEPREKLIKKLSAYDFVINIENSTSNQTPSKIIDYVLAKRPVFSFTQDNFDKLLFLEYFNGDYSRQKSYDISENNIEYVTHKFIELYERKKSANTSLQIEGGDRVMKIV